MPINKNEITKEMLEKAMQCKDADDLMNLAKANGFDITKEEAEAYRQSWTTRNWTASSLSAWLAAKKTIWNATLIAQKIATSGPKSSSSITSGFTLIHFPLQLKALQPCYARSHAQQGLLISSPFFASRR